MTVPARAARSRLEPAVFNLPVGRLRAGRYSDAYFNLTKELLEVEGRHPRVLMQVFQKEASVLGGVDEAIAVRKLGAGRSQDGFWVPGWEELGVRALHAIGCRPTRRRRGGAGAASGRSRTRC